MPANSPTILATSGGFVPGRRTLLRPGPILDYALDLATPRATASRPRRLCYLGTAGGDQEHGSARVLAAFAERRDVQASVLTLFPMPNVADVATHLLQQDVIWVGGGSVANLLAVWRVHGIDDILGQAWRAGVVLAGVSAGSICWHVGGTTDSFGPDLREVTNGLALLPFGNGVHYNSEAQRRPLLHSLVADGTLPVSFATDDGVGLLYRGTEFVHAVADRANAGAYRVERGADGVVVETALTVRRLDREGTA